MGLLVLYLGMAFAGYIVGAKFMRNDKDYSWTGKITTVCLVILIFVMGARIGSDERVISSLQTIGIMAVIITAFCSAGSIFAVFVARKLMGINRKGERKND